MDGLQTPWLQGLARRAANTGRLPGLYRARVVGGDAGSDPFGTGRLPVRIPDVSDQVLWAELCRNGAGDVLPVGAGAWVMFEAGDPLRPALIGGAR